MKNQSTLELRNIDVEKIKKNMKMKPRRNPIHKDFVDNCDDVFNKFDISLIQVGKGGHNIVYKNDHFVLRISRFILRDMSVDTSGNNIDMDDNKNENDNDKYIDKSLKLKDESILLKAVKKDLSPRVYMLGNISIKGFVHRYCIMEAYDISLTSFIKRMKYNDLLTLEKSRYKNKDEIFEHIVEQVCENIDNILHANIVYYDIKPENIVLRTHKETGEISIKFIDWDSDFCVEEPWLYTGTDEECLKNKECVKFLNICTIGYYMYRYMNCNIFFKKVKDYGDFSNLLLTSYKLVLDEDSQFMTIMLEYFYRGFRMTEKEKDELDVEKASDRLLMKKNILHMVETAATSSHS